MIVCNCLWVQVCRIDRVESLFITLNWCIITLLGNVTKLKSKLGFSILKFFHLKVPTQSPSGQGPQKTQHCALSTLYNAKSIIYILNKQEKYAHINLLISESILWVQSLIDSHTLLFFRIICDPDQLCII